VTGDAPVSSGAPVTAGAPGDPAPTRARQRRERERAAVRASILSAARDLARREGWDAVTMRRLADKIEYSANFAYRYFTGRDDILLALVRDGFARLRDAMAAADGESAPAPGGTASAPDACPAPSAEAAVRRAGHAYLDFALTEPDLYQLMYGLGGVRVPTADTWNEGQAVGDVLAGLLVAAGDRQPGQHVLQLWATAHGLIALRVVGRVDVDPAALHTLLDDALTDCLARALPGPATSCSAARSTRKKQP
jgi:AcrR family transcriptional regulator